MHDEVHFKNNINRLGIVRTGFNQLSKQINYRLDKSLAHFILMKPGAFGYKNY